MKIYTTVFPLRPEVVMACAILQSTREVTILPLEQLPDEVPPDTLVLGADAPPGVDCIPLPEEGREHPNGAPYSVASMTWDRFGPGLVEAFLEDHPYWSSFVSGSDLVDVLRGTLLAGIDAAASGRLDLQAHIRVPQPREAPKAYVPILPRMLAGYGVSALDAVRYPREQLIAIQKNDFEDAVDLATEALVTSLRHHLLRFATPPLVAGLENHGGYLLLPSGLMPWADAAMARKDQKSIKLVAFPCCFSGAWMVQALTKSARKRNVSRILFPEDVASFPGVRRASRRWLVQVEDEESVHRLCQHVLRGG